MVLNSLVWFHFAQNHYFQKVKMSFQKDICGPFAKGLKCNLSMMKTGTIGQTLMSFLFLCTSSAKFLGKEFMDPYIVIYFDFYSGLSYW